MRLTAENKEKIRVRILSGAAALFREKGVDAVNLDQIMARAELTRGAFYAHFPSKAALFAEVMRHEHPLLRMLRARSDTAPAALQAAMRTIFHNYLSPANLAEVHRGCSFAALTGETARAEPAVRAGFEAAWQDVLTEMARGQAQPAPARLRAALVLATGAVTAAAACDSDAARAAILTDARLTVMELLGSAAP